MKQPIYKRILLKLSGEALRGSSEFLINVDILNRIAREIKELVTIHVQVALVVGGGNILRGTQLKKVGIHHVVSDQIGMLSTVINGLTIRDALHRININASLMSSIPLNGICDHYNYLEAINLLQDNCVVILSGGTGNSCFTTDSAACLRGVEIRADVVLKATKVAGVFTTDPTQDASAYMYRKLSYNEVLTKELRVMDFTSFAIARDYGLPIHIFNINQPGALYRIVIGKQEGTIISNEV